MWKLIKALTIYPFLFLNSREKFELGPGYEFRTFRSLARRSTTCVLQGTNYRFVFTCQFDLKKILSSLKADCRFTLTSVPSAEFDMLLRYLSHLHFFQQQDDPFLKININSDTLLFLSCLACSRSQCLFVESSYPKPLLYIIVYMYSFIRTPVIFFVSSS